MRGGKSGGHVTYVTADGCAGWDFNISALQRAPSCRFDSDRARRAGRAWVRTAPTRLNNGPSTMQASAVHAATRRMVSGESQAVAALLSWSVFERGMLMILEPPSYTVTWPLTKASGAYVVFADGFARPDKASDKADYRPSSLAVRTDGALYVDDDKQGRIWRITYLGSRAATLAAESPGNVREAAKTPQKPAPKPSLDPIAGSDRAKIALGQRLYAGEIAQANCAGCHEADAQGTPVRPNLSGADWLWSNGNVAGTHRSIKDGVPKPKQYPAPIPPMEEWTLIKPRLTR